MPIKAPDDGLTPSLRNYYRHRDKRLAQHRVWRENRDPEERREYEQEYREEHREEIRVGDQRRWPKRRKKEAARKKAAYEADPETFRQKLQESYLAHREERLAYAARRRKHKRARVLLLLLLNLDVFLERAEAARMARVAYVRDACRQRRARKRNAPINDLTEEQWAEIQEAHQHRCAYCGKRAKGKLAQDHITPLSKGGSHTASNVVPACKSCNSSKNNRAPLVPVQPLLLTVAPSKKLKKAD